MFSLIVRTPRKLWISILAAAICAAVVPVAKAESREAHPSPKEAKESLELGEMLLFNGHAASAQKALEKAAQFDPDLLQVHIDLANLYSSKYPEAQIKELAEIVRLKPKDFNARASLAAAENAQGHYQEAVKDFSQALAGAKNPDSIRLELAFARLNAGDIEGALEEFNKLPNQGDTRVLLGLAMCKFKMGKIEAASELIDRVISQSPANAEAHCLKGDLLYSQADKVGAIKEYRQSLSQDPALLQVYTSLGSLYLNEGKYEESRKIFFQAAQMRPQNCDVLYGLALSLEKCGEVEAATKVYSEALQYEHQATRREAIKAHISQLNKI